MASETRSALCALLVLMLAVSMAAEVEGASKKAPAHKPVNKPRQHPPCNIDTLKPLLPCIPAITGPLPPSPSKECCAGVRRTDASCLCTHVKSGHLPITLNLDAALSLPKKCKRWVPRGFKCGGMYKIFFGHKPLDPFIHTYICHCCYIDSITSNGNIERILPKRYRAAMILVARSVRSEYDLSRC